MTAMRISFLKKDILIVACGGLSGAGSNRKLALRMATLSPAERFGLSDRGALTPGRKADFCVVDDLHQFIVKKVFVGEKRFTRFIPCPAPASLQPSPAKYLLWMKYGSRAVEKPA